MIVDIEETKQVLMSFASLGFDLTKSMKIDFFIEGNREGLKGVEIDVHKEISIYSINTEIEYDNSFDVWTCYCTVGYSEIRRAVIFNSFK